ncbi:MAG: hypothetical protein LBG98_03710 [Puniceicoccales bacterium]|jgi:hypothetical protein|nr:hypothetical protein [Puniceicoccales bacterium]
MPKNPIEDELEMDFGLTNVTQTKREKPSMHLPQNGGFDPSEGLIENRLSKVIEMQNLDDILLQLLKPSVEDRRILNPLQFRQKIKELGHFFREKREQDDDPTTEALWDSLISLLHNEEEKGELLDHYRHMLHMG